MGKSIFNTIAQPFAALSCPRRLALIVGILNNEGQNVISAPILAKSAGLTVSVTKNLLFDLKSNIGVIDHDGAKYFISNEDIKAIALGIVGKYGLNQKAQN